MSLQRQTITDKRLLTNVLKPVCTSKVFLLFLCVVFFPVYVVLLREVYN